MSLLGLTGMLTLALAASAGPPAPSGLELVAPDGARPVSGDVPFLVRSADPLRRVAFAIDGWVLDVDRRENELQQVLPPTATPTDVCSPWVAAW